MVSLVVSIFDLKLLTTKEGRQKRACQFGSQPFYRSEKEGWAKLPFVFVSWNRSLADDEPKGDCQTKEAKIFSR